MFFSAAAALLALQSAPTTAPVQAMAPKSPLYLAQPDST